MCADGEDENASRWSLEPDLHFDGEDESVKRFLLATRLIIAQIAEIIRPRGPGFNEKSPPSAENDAGEDASMKKKKSETERVTYNHADPFDAYDSSDEEKAVQSDTGVLALPPPLGSHVVRCVETPGSLDFVRSTPDGTPLSVYFQENNAYNFKDIRTADHFLDGSRQKIRSSTKIQAIPRAEMYGASLLIHLELPGPMDREEKLSRRTFAEKVVTSSYTVRADIRITYRAGEDAITVRDRNEASIPKCTRSRYRRSKRTSFTCVNPSASSAAA